MKDILINTSISDAIDRLTILNVKLKKISNNKKLDEINKEKTLLEHHLSPIMSNTIKYYIRILEIVNETIWDLLDKAKYEEKNKDNELDYYRSQEDYNERRFRIKRIIDNYILSNIKEQKGYQERKAFLLTHLGLGDNFYHIGMARYLSTIYDEVHIVCKTRNLENLKLVFSDCLDVIKFFTVESDKDISPNFGFNMNIFKDITKNMDLFLCGSHNLDKDIPIHYPFSFFEEFNISKSVFWDYSYISKTPKCELLYNLVKDYKYAFIHNTCSYGEVFKISKVQDKLNIDIDKILVINPNYNIYEKSHHFYELANKFFNYYLSDYITLIENAEYIILSDSSFFGMAIHLEIKTHHCYYNARELNYDHIYDVPHKSKIIRSIFKNLNNM